MAENCPDEEFLALQTKIQDAVELYNRTVPTYKQVHRIQYYREPFAKTAVGKMIRSTVTGVNHS
jgi:hypothetical protein